MPVESRPPRLASRKRRRRVAVMRRRVVVLGAALLLIVLAWNLIARSIHHGAPAALPTATPPSVTPYSSAFVRSGRPWSRADAAAVQRLTRRIVNGTGFPSTTAAVVMDARDGAVLYAHNPHVPLVPASTLKLIVAATALHQFGANFRFQTQLVTDGAVADGSIQGDVYLVGGGDPELATSDIRAAVGQLKREGVTRIDGGVVADGTLYGPDEVNKTWDPDDLEYGWAAPPSAITRKNWRKTIFSASVCASDGSISGSRATPG